MSELNQTMLLFPLMAVAALIGLGLVLQLRRRYNLRGKTVLITGGSRGLGLLIARELAREGARIAICARDQAELERAQADLSQRGADVFARPCDVTDQAQVNEMVQAVGDRFGPIDVLINNAGIIRLDL